MVRRWAVTSAVHGLGLCGRAAGVRDELPAYRAIGWTRPHRERNRRSQRPGGTTDARGDRRCCGTALWFGVVYGAGLGDMNMLAAGRYVSPRRFAERHHDLAWTEVSVRKQACPPACQVGEPAVARDSRGIVRTGVMQVLSIRGFGEHCHDVAPELHSAGMSRGFMASRAPVRGQSPKVESRLSAVQPAMVNTPSRTIRPSIANAIIRIASSPQLRVESTAAFAELNDAVRIATMLGLAPVRHCAS